MFIPFKCHFRSDDSSQAEVRSVHALRKGRTHATLTRRSARNQKRNCEADVRRKNRCLEESDSPRGMAQHLGGHGDLLLVLRW